MVRTWKNSSETHDSDGSQALVMIRSSVVAVAICGRLLLFSFLFLSWVCILFFFFSSRRRHTRLTCDWSSDVCSSDLRPFRNDHPSCTNWPYAAQRFPCRTLPVWGPRPPGLQSGLLPGAFLPIDLVFERRSEERRVGKECRCRWAAYQLKRR